jgi:hypothetical protein
LGHHYAIWTSDNFFTGPKKKIWASLRLISGTVMVLYQTCVFGADLKSNMAARVHNVISLAEVLKIFLSETTKSIEL